jgi:hypothetical protein
MKLGKNSALNLTLNGSVGSFKVRANDNPSLEVKYLLTHVGLNLKDSQNVQLLKELKPFRETFDIKSLGFDEIMQRDIDDARISSEIIPYILDNRSTGMVKFFPPIVVICMPINSDDPNPRECYPTCTEETDDTEINGHSLWKTLQSGAIGSEVFKFRQPMVGEDEIVNQHDLIELKVNTAKSQLIIVDGQHRAMALLALYRNMKKDWSDARRKPYESYYREWDKDYLDNKKINLDDIQLPMIVCTVPELDEDYKGDYNLKKACRSIFLTLNKNARHVSQSRNILLDDADLFSEFMRRVLSEIKSNDNSDRSSTLAIHSVELDQESDKTKIKDAVSITGVNHIYYIIENIMLDDGRIFGIKPRSGNYRARVTNSMIENCLIKLNCRDNLGDDSYSNIRRDFYNTGEIDVLKDEFYSKYGKYIVKMFAEFSAYKASNNAAWELKEKLENHADSLLKPMIFDGQGMTRTFLAHRKNIKENLKKMSSKKAEIIHSTLEGTNNSLQESISKYKEVRVNNLLAGIRDTAKIQKYVDNVYDNVFTTVAFQCALISTFFNIIEKFEKGNEIDDNIKTSLYDEYLKRVGDFMAPSTWPQLKKFIGMFVGEVKGDNIQDFQITEGGYFKKVVYPQEMKPDSWPSYRYLFLELWRLAEIQGFDGLKSIIDKEIDVARKQISENLYKRTRDSYMSFQNLSELTSEQKEEVKATCVSRYKELLGLVGVGNIKGLNILNWFE